MTEFKILNNLPLTIGNIVDTLKKEGVNSKGQVIDRLENASKDDLLHLANDCMFKILYDCPFNDFKANYEEEKYE